MKLSESLERSCTNVNRKKVSLWKRYAYFYSWVRVISILDKNESRNVESGKMLIIKKTIHMSTNDLFFLHLFLFWVQKL